MAAGVTARGRGSIVALVVLLAGAALADVKPQLGPPAPAAPPPADPPPAEATPAAPGAEGAPAAPGAEGAPEPAAAKELGEHQAQLSAKYVKTDGRADVVYAEGDLRVRWRDLDIAGERAHLDRQTKELRVEGPIHLTRDDGTTLETSNFTLRTDKYWYQTGPFTAVLPAEVVGYGAVEPFYLSGQDSFSIRDTYFAAHGVELSSCPPNDPKYRITAGTVAVVPNKKLIFRRAKLHLFGIPLLAVPKLVLPLRRYRSTEWLPEFGRNDVYGFFSRMRYFYDLADSQYGNVSGMMTEKRGMFLGVEHDFGWGRGTSRGDGRVDFEYGSRQAEMSLRGNLSQSLFEGTDFRINGSYSQNSGFSTTSKQSNVTGQLTHRFDLGSTTLGYNRSQTDSASLTSMYTRWNLNQKLSLGPIFDADLNADYSNRQSTNSPTDEELETRLRFGGQWTLFDWEVLDERRFDLEGSEYAADDNRAVTEIVPQLTLITDARRLGLPLGKLANLRLQTSVGQFREFIQQANGSDPTRSTVLRVNFDLNGDLARVALGPRLRFLSTVRYSQSFFDHPDPSAKYIVAFAPTFEWRPWANTRFDGRYRWQEVSGFSPLSRFDFAQTLNDFDYTGYFFVPDRARPRQGRFALTVNGGYDMLRGQHRELRFGARYQPLDALLVDLNATYSLSGAGLRTVRGEVVYDGGRRWRHEVGFNYDARNGRLQNLDSLLTFEPFSHVTVQNALTWDGYTERVSYNDVLVTYDLGCVSLVGTYRQQAKEFRLDLNIAALPGIASLFGTGTFGQQFSTSQGFQF